jgi:hypothetical protein
MPETLCGFNDDPNDPNAPSGAILLATWGPTLLVDIGFDKDWNLQSASTPKLAISGVNALVDTGASESCIDDLLATQLNLPVIDRRPMSGIGGAQEAKIYLAQIYIPSLGFTIYGAFAGVHLEAGGQVHKALIGRTFLSGFIMIYEGTTGKVILKSP